MSTKIYTLYTDDVQTLEVREDYNEFYFSEFQQGGAWNFNTSESKSKCWQPIEFYRDELLLPRPDIWKFGEVLILEQRAQQVLKELIPLCGELYNQPIEGASGAVWHVQHVLDVLEGNDDSPEEGLVYHVNQIERSIFTLSTGGGLRAISGHTPPGLDFKKLVEANGLTGLVFDEVWDSETEYPTPKPEESDD